MAGSLRCSVELRRGLHSTVGSSDDRDDRQVRSIYPRRGMDRSEKSNENQMNWSGLTLASSKLIGKLN
jgi:hypothetical protein